MPNSLCSQRRRRFTNYSVSAVRLAMQKVKMTTTRWKMLVAREGGLGDSLAIRCTLPLLEMETRWLTLQLDPGTARITDRFAKTALRWPGVNLPPALHYRVALKLSRSSALRMSFEWRLVAEAFHCLVFD